jgi:GNAT superfamily N-acetyltransferase
MPTNDCRFSVFDYTSPHYGTHLGKAFTFFRRHADGKYTDRTMMTLVNNMDTFVAFRGDGERLATVSPLLVVAETPFSYDEVSEVKSGGVMGMGVIDPRTRRMMIAVHKDARRQGIGSQIYVQARRNLANGIVMWAGRRNTIGQHFCLSVGLFATALNSQGAIRFSMEDDEDE